MNPTDAARLVALHASLQSQAQRMRDAHEDYIAAYNRLLVALEPVVRQARTALDEHCREAEEKIVKLRPSVVLPTERQT